MAKDKKKFWEKERRDHLKQAFLSLEKLLPSYDPSNAASRIDVITKSIEYIEEMRNIIQELLKPHSEVNHKVLKLMNLQERIKRLVGRMEILSRLLREAKIPIPQAHKWKEFKQKHRKWSGKINDKKASVLEDNTEGKNGNDEENSNSSKKTLITTKCKSNSSLLLKRRKNIVNRVKKEPVTKQKLLQPTTSNCLIIYTQAYNTPPCYLVNSTPSNNLAGSSKTVITNSLVSSKPVMATNVKGNKRAVTESNSKTQAVGAGTLILTNGNLYPVMPQSQPILSTPMLLQVTNNTNATTVNLQSDKTKKKVDTDQKALKTTRKIIKKPPIEASETISKKLPSSIIFPCGPNLLPNKNKPIITAPTGKVPIPPAPNTFTSKIPLTSRRKVKGRRIGDKPVSRQALKRIRRMNKNIEIEEERVIKKSKTENCLKDASDQTNEKLSEKEPLNDVNLISNLLPSKNSSRTEVNLTEKVKVNDAKGVMNSNHTLTDKVISIVADDVVKPSNQNVTAGFKNNSEIATTGVKKTCDGKLGETKLISSNTTESQNCKVEEAKNYVAQNSATVEIMNQTSDVSKTDLKTSVQPESTSLLSNSDIELKQLADTSGKPELAENSQKNSDESKTDALISNQQTNDEQNIRPDSNLDLDNVCSMNQQLKHLDLHLGHSELSNDIFASLQVPPGCQNPESTSPTAAFLLAFPLVSSLTGVKVTEVLDEDNPDSQRETPTLLQIGTMDTTKSTQSESFTPNLLNLDFFSSKDIYSGFYNSFEQHLSGLTMLPSSSINEIPKVSVKNTSGSKFSDNFRTSNSMNNIQASTTSKETSISGQTSQAQINSEDHNNRVISSSIDCQPSFSFESKQSNAVSTANIISSIPYPDKPIIQNNPDKNTNSQSIDVAKSTKTIEKITVTNDQSNIHIVKDNSKVETTNKNASEKIFNNIIKRDTCHNIFNVGEINIDLQSMQKNIGRVNNMSFYPEKQRPVVSKDFHLQNTSIKNANVGSLFRDNIQDTQMPFIANRNFLTAPMHSNELNSSFGINNNPSFVSKNMNLKNYNQQNQVDSSHKVINPYFTPENKTYSLPNQNNTKTSTADNRMNETQKYFPYNHFNLENKKTPKNNEINFNYNIDNKIATVPKMVESKQATPNYGMNYLNTTYDITNITKVSTCAYNSSNKPTSEPLYTTSNSNNYTYYSNTENYLNETCYKTVKNDKNHAELDNYTNYKKTDFNSAYYPENQRKNIAPIAKSDTTQEKSTYNWMTTPTKTTSDHIVPSFSKDDMIYSNSNLVNSTQTSYFNPTSMYSNDLNTNTNQTQKKTFDMPLVNMNYQKPEVEEGQNQFTWSPTKMPQFLDPVPSFVSSTLPTLVGDLALGQSNFTEQKYDFLNKCTKETKTRSTTKMGYENQNNFFSVSQLVHTSEKVVPVKSMRRRNSGSASKNNQAKNKKIIKNNEEQKEVTQCFNKSPGSQSHAKIENKNFNCRQTNNTNFCDKRSSLKVSSSIYSAESLIGHQGHSEQHSKKDQSFSGNPAKNFSVPPYIPDNIMPYFPPVDLQQDNIIQQNQNYQNFPNFTTFSNNSYSSNTFIPSSTITTPYISSSTFVSDIGVGNEFSTENMNLFPNTAMNKVKIGTKNNSGHREEKNVHNNPCTDILAKKKRKSVNEMNVPTNLVDFSFLSVPGSINSPLLPDDFHSHSTFLPPPPTQSQLYPCKNTLYPPKQSTITSTAPLLPLPPIPSVTRSVIHPEISPSLNSAGTSLTNFNLSTIFPEINKSSMSDIYSGNQAKVQSVDRQYPSSSVPFNAKSTFTYPNGPITQPYGIDNNR